MDLTCWGLGMPEIKVGSDTVYYTIQGSANAPWVTLVNGHMREHTDFRAFSKQLEQHGFSVLMLDNRGVGQSPVSEAFTLSDMAEDILRIWHDQSIQTTHLLGISMGGAISQLLADSRARRHGIDLQSLTLVSTYNDTDQPSAGMDTSWPTNEAAILQRLSHYVTEEFFQKNRLLLKAMAKQMTKNFRSEAYQKGAQYQRQALASLDLPKEGLAQDIPTLIIHGEDDKIIPVRAAYRIQESIPHAELDVISKVGHLLLAECPKQLYQTVIQFLKKLENMP